jgi:hypothetical protein
MAFFIPWRVNQSGPRCGCQLVLRQLAGHLLKLGRQLHWQVGRLRAKPSESKYFNGDQDEKAYPADRGY